MAGMKQRYHTIIKPEPTGWYVGWVEEVPGTITKGRSLEECRENLRNALRLMVETHRDEARVGLSPSCILESIEIDVIEPPYQPYIPDDYMGQPAHDGRMTSAPRPWGLHSGSTAVARRPGGCRRRSFRALKNG